MNKHNDILVGLAVIIFFIVLYAVAVRYFNLVQEIPAPAPAPAAPLAHNPGEPTPVGPFVIDHIKG